ncbi:GDSL-type esterase/lipase family protein [Fictibacillus sp. B-59209]|uniref:GDSL-type esterase/lipase family protein n=1 Tax=Fictibacillus sp. B-59209 TaxID=3024873 RepID=UPI002E1E496A|nr:GDSL-type esterase/lipase family protein [Fictibacillus sp. B-59209]
MTNGIEERQREKEFLPSIVAFGDSITAMEWPDYFKERLVKESVPCHLLRRGISGNKVLTDSPEHYNFGVSGIKRFKQDALGTSDVKYVIVLHGVNDIIHSCGSNPISEEVEAEEIIEALKTNIKWAHEKNIQIFGGTLLPFGGYRGVTDTEEAKRQKVNHWIRNSGEFDQVIDFEAVVQDPNHPERLLREFDSGDHLHPSSKGSEALAECIELHFFD